MAFTHDVFFVGKEGFEEHIQITSEDVVSLIKDRESLLTGLVEAGATVRQSTGKFNKPAQGVATPEPMAAAAAKVFGTQIAVECPNGCGEMKYVPAGVSRASGKPYPSFYSCKQCGTKQNAPKA